MTEATRSTETSINIYQSTQRHALKDLHLHHDQFSPRNNKFTELVHLPTAAVFIYLFRTFSGAFA